MPIFFSRLKVGHPGPLKALEDFPESWKVYTICTTNHPHSSTTFADVNQLSREDKKHARNAFSTLLGKAQIGQPIKDLYSEKKCHEVHTFDHNGTTHVIYRIRNGDVRVYFCYVPPEKNIVILKTSTKHKDKLNTHEKLELEEIAKQVLDYSDPAIFMTRVI